MFISDSLDICDPVLTFGECMEDIFADINKKIFEVEGADLNHLYIGGSKFEANANKYS